MGRTPAHRAPRQRRLTPTTAGAAAAGAVAVVVMAQTLLLPSTDTAAATTPPDAVVGGAVAATPVDVPEDDGTATMAVIGDSYMNGKGGAEGAGMGQELARRLGMDLVNLAEGGTGWADDGPEPDLTSSYDEHAEATLAADPDLVVVAGGYNDHAAINKQLETYDEVRDSARSLLTRLAGAPGVQTVVMGPFWVNGDPPRSLLLLRDVVQLEAERAGVDFVDPIAEGWITGDRRDLTGNAATLIRKDRIHPTPKGHRYFGRKMAVSVAALR